MTGERAPAAVAERGFVLVGVVMIVLALSILGLSLFSLSSFEAQFMRRSLDHERAFTAAAGAVERVKFNLFRSGRLEHSWFGFPDAVVDSARAWQWKSGVMVENGFLDPGVVHIRVHSRVGDAVQTVYGEYTLNAVDNTYRRLITTSGAVSVLVSPPAQNPNTVKLAGVIYEKAANSGWPGLLRGPVPDSIRHNVAWIPPPSVQSMFDAHLATAAVAGLTVAGGNPTWVFDANGQQPGYFKTALDPGFNINPNYSLSYPGGAFFVQVRGPVVWLLPKGVRGFTEMGVDLLPGGTNNCLVIIAGTHTDPDPLVFNKGIIFPNGIHNPENVPIILVTPGRIILHRGPENSPPRIHTYLTTYSGSIEIAGHQSLDLDLRHPIGHANDLPGGLVDLLLSWGALPGGTPTTSQLQLISGSWQETKN